MFCAAKSARTAMTDVQKPVHRVCRWRPTSLRPVCAQYVGRNADDVVERFMHPRDFVLQSALITLAAGRAAGTLTGVFVVSPAGFFGQLTAVARRRWAPLASIGRHVATHTGLQPLGAKEQQRPK